jgi:hypothetical protein
VAIGAGLLAAVALVGCSSDSSSSTTLSTPAPTVAPPVTTGPITDVTLSADLRGKEAIDVMKAMFRLGGIDPDIQHDGQSLARIKVCPLGKPDVLTSVVAPVATGLQAKVTYTLEMNRDPVPTIRCTFSDNLPVDTANTNPSVKSGALLDYQATYLSGDQLTRYITLLDANGFEKVGPLFGGNMYRRCDTPDPAVSLPATRYGQCAAIWLNGVILLGVQYSGPSGDSIDLVPTLTSLIEPMVTSLATTDPAAVGVPPPATTTPPSTT